MQSSCRLNGDIALKTDLDVFECGWQMFIEQIEIHLANFKVPYEGRDSHHHPMNVKDDTSKKVAKNSEGRIVKRKKFLGNGAYIEGEYFYQALSEIFIVALRIYKSRAAAVLINS